MRYEKECPHCGRPFVDMHAYANHVHGCMKKRQAELDREWAERHIRPRIVSQPGAAIEVTEYELSQPERDALTIDDK